MRKIMFLTVILLTVYAITVAAAGTTCTDPDEKPDPEDSIHDISTVKYGLSEKTDECVSGRDGYHLDPSTWVREYYCTEVQATGESTGKIIQRKYTDYDCVRYGYTKCDGGRCTGKAGSSSTSSTPKPTAKPQCGDKILQKDRGEQCEPPDSVCYVDKAIGVCTRPNAQGLGGCQCKVYSGSAAEETPTPEETAEPTETEEPEETETPEEIADKTEEPTPTMTETREPLPEDLDSSKGIGVTRAITNGVKKFFRWMGSWFD
jgi:hypothetical protein